MNEVTDLEVYVTSEKEALYTVANYLQNEIGVTASQILDNALYAGIYPEDGGQVYMVHKKTKTRKDVPIYITFAYWMVNEKS